MKLKLGIAGASGRMGQALIRAVLQDKNCELVAGLVSPTSAQLGVDLGLLVGLETLGVKTSAEPQSWAGQMAGWIDFSTPATTVMLAQLAAQHGMVHVIGTTGLNHEEQERINQAGRTARIVQSGNMSLGVNLLSALVQKVAATLGPEFDIEIIEMHHRHKRDAPSGTALLLGEAAAKGRNIDLASHSPSHTAPPQGPRKVGDIGFASLRGGSVIGEHTVIFAGQAERIELSHKAESREIFAKGAVRAALWAKPQPPGHYNMMNVLGLE